MKVRRLDTLLNPRKQQSHAYNPQYPPPNNCELGVKLWPQMLTWCHLKCQPLEVTNNQSRKTDRTICILSEAILQHEISTSHAAGHADMIMWQEIVNMAVRKGTDELVFLCL